MNRIVDDFLEKIDNRDYCCDEKLPSEKELSKRYNMSRHDVRRAYERLTDMGLVFSKPGIGHFVKSKRKKIDLNLSGSDGFTQKVKSQGILMQTKNLGIQSVKASKKIARVLDVKPESEVYRISRLRLFENEPVAIHTSFLNPHRFPEIEKYGHVIKSMGQYFREKGYEFSFDNSIIQMVFATDKQRKQLSLEPLVPLMLLECVCREKIKGSALEYSHVLFRGDIFTYQINMS